MADRIRGRKLQQRRLTVWSQDPHCARCGKVTEWPHGFELDHTTALDNGGADTEDNVQVLCSGDEGCHRKKTAEDMGYRHKPKVGTDGWPA